MIALFRFACAGSGDPGEGGGRDSSGASVPCDADVDVEVSATGMGNVPRLTWDSAEAVATRVRFSNGAEVTRETVLSVATTTHDAVLVGVLPSVDFTWEILEVDGDAERCVASGTATNGPLPAGVPEVTATVAGGASAGLTVAPVLAGAPQTDNWLMIFDEQGRVVWAYEASAGEGGAVFVTTAAFANDGSGILYNAAAVGADSPGWIAKVSFAGEFQKLAEVNGLHTDFVEMDEGRIASLTWEVRQVGEWRLLGDHVVVIEADGSSRSIWNSFDSVPFVEDGDWVEGFYVPDPTVADWSHVNSVTWNAAANALMITMTAQDGVAKINAETGEMSWLYGDEVGAFGGSPGLTEAPHSAELLDDGHVLVFNRGDFLHDPINACSWAAELSVDAGTGAMTEVARWESAGCTLVTYLGSARRLPGGTTMVDWTSAGRIDQLTAADEAAWSVALSAGHAFGYADFLPLPAAGP